MVPKEVGHDAAKYVGGNVRTGMAKVGIVVDRWTTGVPGKWTALVRDGIMSGWHGFNLFGQTVVQGRGRCGGGGQG